MDTDIDMPLFREWNEWWFADAKAEASAGAGDNRGKMISMRHCAYSNQNSALVDAVEETDPRRARTDRLQEEMVSDISGDRRSRRRFDLNLQLLYKVFGRNGFRTGVGRTVDLSTTGIAFDAGDALPLGVSIELAIAWPVLLHQSCPLKLVVRGKVVRSDLGFTAVCTERYEFRTQGTGVLRTMAAGYTS